MKPGYKSIMATVILLSFITSTALSSTDENRACNGCHTYSPQSINITTDINSIIVSSNESFVVNINWTGGDPYGDTAINWPTNFANIALTRDNTLFNPNPRIPASVTNTPSGTTNSTLTAPQVPGTYTVRVYASRGQNATLGKVTDFMDITVIVQASYNVSLKVDFTEKTTLPGVNASYLLTINNTGNAPDNYTLKVSNPDGAAWGLTNTQIQNLAAGASATVLLNVTNASIGTFRVNATAKSTGSNKTATVNTTTTVSIQPRGGAPKIISYFPSTFIFNDSNYVFNEDGDSRNFNIKINQTVNVTWYISGIEVFNQSGVTESTYMNTSAATGFWNVEAIVSNQKGSESNKWIWIVSKTHSGNKKTQIRIKPETLNLASKGTFKASIRLPEGYDVDNINISTVMCEGAPALKGKIKKNGNVLEVKFNRQDLVNVSIGKAVRLTVTGMLMDGTKFDGSDIIRVINKGNSNDDEEDDEVEEDEEDESEDVKDDHSDKVKSDSKGNIKKKVSDKGKSSSKGKNK